MGEKSTPDFHAFIRDVQRCESQARVLGLHITARALNNAKNAAGWERAGAITTAANAGRGVRPGDDRWQS